MQRLAAFALIALVTAGCFGGDGETAGGGLIAKTLDVKADDVIKGPRGIYVVDSFDVQAIDTNTGQASGAPIHVSADGPRYAPDDDGAIWYTDVNGHTAGRVTQGDAVTELTMPEGEPVGVAFGDGHGWVSSPDPPIVVPFAKDGRAGEPVETPCSLYNLVVSDGAVWGACDTGVVRIDTDTRQADLIDTGGKPRQLTATSSHMWALVGDHLVSIDIATSAASDPVSAPADAYGLAGEGDDLWIAAGADTGRLITRHNASDAALIAGPVEVPGSSDDVPAQVGSMEGLGDDLWLSVSFYGSELVVVRQDR